MTIEHIWRSKEIAAEWKEEAQTAVILAAPPREMRDGTHAFGRHAPGHTTPATSNDEATGYFVGIDLTTRAPVIFTHQSPYKSAAPTRADTEYLGTVERDNLVLLTVPAHPKTLSIGAGGLGRDELRPDQLAVVREVCGDKLPQPRIAGVPTPPGARSWATAELV